MTGRYEKLEPEEEQVLLLRLLNALKGADPEGEFAAPESSQESLKLIESKLNYLVALVECSTADRIEPYEAQIREVICGKCFVQQPSGFCPQRESGACALARNPRLIVEIIERYLVETGRRPPPLGQPLKFGGEFDVEARKEKFMFSRILIAVDDSAPALSAVAAGMELARKVEGKLAVIHVIPPPIAMTIGEAALYGRVTEAQRVEQGKALLKKIRAQIPADLPIEEMLREGHPADEIVIAAHDWDADIILIGTHGRQGISRFVLGSTAEAVARRAGCAVLVAREKAGATQHVLEQVVGPPVGAAK